MKTYEVYIPETTGPRYVDADRHVLLGDLELLYLYDEEGETLCVFREWVWFRIQRHGDAKEETPLPEGSIPISNIHIEDQYDQSGFRLGGTSQGSIERPFA